MKELIETRIAEEEIQNNGATDISCEEGPCPDAELNEQLTETSLAPVVTSPTAEGEVVEPVTSIPDVSGDDESEEGDIFYPSAVASAKAVSDRKLAANRLNAQKSTGPRTPIGRANSRQNALKHGIFASNMLVYGENLAEYEDLKEVLFEDLAPVGGLEESLVEKVAICNWRWKRALCAESNSANKAVDKYGFKDWLTIDYLDKQLNRLVRYETTLDRQMASALNRLERLQRARRAKEELPPPPAEPLSEEE
jgi:hypothetical protein